MYDFDVSDREINPMWNIMWLKERQDCIEMFRIRHAHDFPIFKDVHPKIWGTQIVSESHTLKNSVIMCCIGDKRMCTRQMTGDIRSKNMEILCQIIQDFIGGIRRIQSVPHRVILRIRRPIVAHHHDNIIFLLMYFFL